MSKKSNPSSNYTKNLIKFAKSASKTNKGKSYLDKATLKFFAEVSKLKASGKSGSRTWIARNYTDAIIAGLNEFPSSKKLKYYTKDSDLNIDLSHGALIKKKRPDIIIILDEKMFIIEIKASARLNEIMSAGCEFAIIKHIGKKFCSRHLSSFKPSSIPMKQFILFSGYSDNSYVHDIKVVQKALKFNFSEVSWFRTGKSNSWSHELSYNSIFTFYKFISKP